MRLFYLAASLIPVVSVLALTWFVARAISVRVVWRQEAQLDDEVA